MNTLLKRHIKSKNILLFGKPKYFILYFDVIASFDMLLGLSL